MIYYLKANSEQELWESLEQAGLAKKVYVKGDERNIPPNEYVSDWFPSGNFVWECISPIDIIGEIKLVESCVKQGDEYITTFKTVEGFHANLDAVLTENQKELLPIIDAPDTPIRTWM